jgi:hypothetical protein
MPLVFAREKVCYYTEILGAEFESQTINREICVCCGGVKSLLVFAINPEDGGVKQESRGDGSPAFPR